MAIKIEFGELHNLLIDIHIAFYENPEPWPLSGTTTSK